MGSSNSRHAINFKNPLNEMKQIEEWTGMKIGSIIFDSDVDNWNKNTSVFDQKVLNKSNLIFVIEDDDNNLFGGYVNAIINKYGHVNDPKSFVFSLQSNGRLNGMCKFDVIKPNFSFFLLEKTANCLFMFGYDSGCDIGAYKFNYKNVCICVQDSFEYERIENALCGERFFALQRITVIQLI